MNHITTLSIDTQRLPNFQQLTLYECTGDHSTFTIDLDIAELETRGAHTIDASKDFLGKTLVIAFGADANTEFLGVIDHMTLENSHGHEGTIRLQGKSKTLKLHGLPTNKSWLNKSLQHIVSEVVEASGLVEAQIQPSYKGTLEYTVQYQESNWDFIRRLSRTFGEPLEYNGLHLTFGNKYIESPIGLEYGRELSNISVGIKTRPVNDHVFSYNSEQDHHTEATAKNDVAGLNELGLYAFDQSLEFYKNQATAHTEVRTPYKSDVECYIAHKQGARVADLHVLEADCHVQGLQLGTIITVKSARNQGNWEGFEVKSYGEYKIISIKHSATGKGRYHCRFKAIPSGITVVPSPKVALPQCPSQLAVVTANADPRGMGRVKVQLHWQKYHETTNWIRVLMPDAGSSEHHAQNRGHVFIPEVGDQVMVGFQYNDPARPYVLGSLFNGTTGAGGGTENTRKSIITKSGHVIAFDDTKRAESITITDRKGNHFIVDTAGETITINALKDININAGENLNITAGKNINISAGENLDESIGKNMTTNVGGDITISATGDLQESSESRKELVDEKFTRNSTTSSEVAGEVSILSESENMILQSGKTVEFNSTEKSNLF